MSGLEVSFDISIQQLFPSTSAPDLNCVKKYLLDFLIEKAQHITSDQLRVMTCVVLALTLSSKKISCPLKVCEQSMSFLNTNKIEKWKSFVLLKYTSIFTTETSGKHSENL
jgi:hypothetical protein